MALVVRFASVFVFDEVAGGVSVFAWWHVPASVGVVFAEGHGLREEGLGSDVFLHGGGVHGCAGYGGWFFAEVEKTFALVGRFL